MRHQDENDLPDAAIKAMWEEGEPVELADRPPRPVAELIPPHPLSRRLLATSTSHSGPTDVSEQIEEILRSESEGH